jgi:CxxC motif-containing protein (DUF1111 family)
MRLGASGRQWRGLIVGGTLLAACDADWAGPNGLDDPAEPRLGGDTTTVSPPSRGSFAFPAANLSSDRLGRFQSGNFIFGRTWVNAGASTTGLDGLGPTFNSQSCSGCHDRDGRGHPPASADEPMFTMLVRLGVPGQDTDGGPRPEPRYGGQLNDRAILGVPVEGRAVVSYAELPGQYADGTPFSLRAPRYEFRDLGYGALAPDLLFSPRVAPAMIGLGLLEALPEATLLGLADPDDRDGDGISGRTNRVFDLRAGAERVGRFGWKANNPSLEQQVAGAFLGDLGITSPLFPEENCPGGQIACRASRSGAGPGETEIDPDRLDKVVTYCHLLAVPAQRRAEDPQVRAGKALFREVGCASCHIETLVTGDLPAFPELERQTIHPYTDLLLHDLGEALADGRPDYLASGSEWRTPPLWGLGLVKTVNGHNTLLHDGRARGFAEAILWHGGEAQASRERFRRLGATERAALVAFLESL